MRAAFLGLMLFATTPALAQQQPDPFTLPPPTQRPQTPPGQTPQPGQQPGTVTMEMLTRQGYEVKTMTRAADRPGTFVVILQRAGETRTCFLRILQDQQRGPRQETLCF